MLKRCYLEGVGGVGGGVEGRSAISQGKRGTKSLLVNGRPMRGDNGMV